MILNNIKQGTMELSELNHNLFIDDYNKLQEVRVAAAFSKLIGEIKRSPALKPFVKGHFDRLMNKYNYFRYKETVLDDNNTRLLLYLFCEGKSQEEKERVYEYIVAYIITETYIGFMVEHELAKAFQEKGIKVHQNNVLDIDYKTDLLVCGKHLQIKNYSFLETQWIENKLKPYGEANKKLRFVFYEINESGLNLLLIGDRCCHKWNSMDDFTQHLPTKRLSLEEFINRVIAE